MTPLRYRSVNCRGQALIETAVFFLMLAPLLACLLDITHAFVVRQKLLLAVREGALLYSSGRMTTAEVREHIKRYLTTGSPVLDERQIEFVRIGRCPGVQETMLGLDQITIRYQRRSRWSRYLMIDPMMEETCIIKHASHYGPPFQTLFGPPIPH